MSNQMGLVLEEKSMVSAVTEKPVLTMGVPAPRIMSGRMIPINDYTVEEAEELIRRGYEIECNKGEAVARLLHEKKPV